MRKERRNHYRLLFVQPEAPPEVIKAAYRALMTSARVHPDLGGDHDQAALLNAAYAVLSDPEQRRAYDLTLKRQRAAPTAAAPTSSKPATAPLCAFCRAPVPTNLRPDSRCPSCEAPLFPVPRESQSAAAVQDLLGRRRTERHRSNAEVHWRLPGQPRAQQARLRDLSFSGLSMSHGQPLPIGAVMHLRADKFEALAQIVACKPQTGGYSIHARLLTLCLVQGARGVYVDARA